MNRFPGNIVASGQLAYLLVKRPDRKDQEEAETLLRDVLRRSPGEIVASGQLAYLLVKRPDRKDQEEAETPLRDVLRRSPGNIVASGQLAYLLAKRPDRKDQEEAETPLRDVLRRSPGEIVASGQLAYLLAKRPDRKDERVPSAGPIDFTADIARTDSQSTLPLPEQLVIEHEISRALEDSIAGSLTDDIESLNRMERREEDIRAPLKSADFPIEIAAESSQPSQSAAGSTMPAIGTIAVTAKASEFSKTPAIVTTKVRRQQAEADLGMAVVLRGGRLRRLAADLKRKLDDDYWRRAALAEVERALAEDKNYAYTQYLKNELREDATIETRPPSGIFAVAFIDAIKKKDPAYFEELEASHSTQSRLIDVARSFLFEDRAAAGRVVQWLNTPTDIEPRSTAALRGFFLQRFGVKISEYRYSLFVADAEALLKLVGANDNIRLDLIESALVPEELALAA